MNVFERITRKQIGARSGSAKTQKDPRKRQVYADLDEAVKAAADTKQSVLYIAPDGNKYKVLPKGKRLAARIQVCKYNTKPPRGYYPEQKRKGEQT